MANRDYQYAVANMETEPPIIISFRLHEIVTVISC